MIKWWLYFQNISGLYRQFMCWFVIIHMYFTLLVVLLLVIANLKLKLYVFYKQAIEGDLSKECPGMFGMVDSAKWNA